MKTYFKEIGSKLNIELTDEMIEQFFLYKNLLLEWNEKINLTAITEEKEILIKHFIDSLTIEKYIPQNARIIDVGTGAGFPGIPIKIVRPDVEVVLLDSLNKRINFLNEVIEKCGLKKITTIHGRAEEVAHKKEYREQFDFSTARAVANISTLSELCTPFLKVGGVFICMKADAAEEMEKAKKALEILGMNEEKIAHISLPNIGDSRTIILYKKTKNTPTKYPRKAGTPAKEPIK